MMNTGLFGGVTLTIKGIDIGHFYWGICEFDFPCNMKLQCIEASFVRQEYK